MCTTYSSHTDVFYVFQSINESILMLISTIKQLRIQCGCVFVYLPVYLSICLLVIVSFFLLFPPFSFFAPFPFFIMGDLQSDAIYSPTPGTSIDVLDLPWKYTYKCPQECTYKCPYECCPYELCPFDCCPYE